jgi:hypothetical protein
MTSYINIKIIANERVDTRENNRTFKIGDEEDRKRE